MCNEQCEFGCIGYAYVPVQTFDKTNCPETALKQASLFPELVLDINKYGCDCTQTGGIE